MGELVLFPDVEAYLAGVLPTFPDLAGVPVKTRVSNPRPPTFIRVTRVGGQRRDLITDLASVVVQTWAPTEDQAALLAKKTRAALGSLSASDHGGVFVQRSEEVTAPEWFPDPASGTPAYQMTFQIQTRGTTT